MKINLIAKLVVLALGLGLASCGWDEGTPPEAGSVIKLGSVSPLTGPQAHLGQDNANGARMAIEEVNAAGVVLGGNKVTFELVVEDDGADPKTATIVAQRLADMHVNGVIGHLNSGTSIPASRIYNDAGIAQITPSATNPKYTQQGFKGAFRAMANDIQQGQVLGQYAVSKLGAKKIAIIDDRSAYGQGLADEFEKAAQGAGAQILTREYTTDKSTDFMAILTGIKGKKPDLVFYGGMDAQAAPMVKQMKQLGLDAKYLAGDGAQSAQFLTLAGADAEGVIASSPGLPLANMPGGKAFEEKFNAKYGKIQIYAPYAYDATMVMIEAMKKADSADPARYIPELAKITHMGVTGPISFDEKGDIKGGSITLYRVKDGNWEVLETVGGAQ
jgi:branched-chain amino acid transport system substrate-binding protein